MTPTIRFACVCDYCWEQTNAGKPRVFYKCLVWKGHMRQNLARHLDAA